MGVVAEKNKYVKEIDFLHSCSTCPAICKSGGTPPCPVVPDPLSGERTLDDGVGSGYLRDGSPLVWSRGKESPGMGSGAPRFQLSVKMGARAPCPMESAPLLVSLTTSISLYTRLTSRLDLLL